jgi:hypothetical protein
MRTSSSLYSNSSKAEELHESIVEEILIPPILEAARHLSEVCREMLHGDPLGQPRRV